MVQILEIVLAENAGFCYGVKRAIEIAEEAACERSIKTLGPLIHNNQEIERLKKKGIISSSSDEVKEGDTILIRSHGVGPEVIRCLEDKGCIIIDATCPNVKKIHEKAMESVKKGYQVVILGDKNHAEVRGIKSWTENSAVVVRDKSELSCVPLSEKVAVMAQTTEKEARFEELVQSLKSRVSDLKIYPTICGATRIRQQQAKELAQKVEVMIVIGGKHSSNTNKLVEICKGYKIPCYHIEEPGELQPRWFLKKALVGVTAGASTPDWIIKEVISNMEEIKEQNVLEQEQEVAQVNEQQLSEDELSFKTFQAGDLVKGKVVKVSADEVLVDIGGKAEAILPAAELAYGRINPIETISVDQEFIVEVLKEDKEGNTIVSRKKAAIDEAYNKLEKAKENDEIITATATEVVKGGLLVDVGVRGFVPASQVDRSFVEDLSVYLNKELKVKVIELDKDNRKAVLSQRIVLDEEAEREKEALWNKIEEGQVRKGVVRRLTNFGAFVDIGGIDGLLHVSEMSWGRINHPSDVVKENDEIEVYVLKLDREKGKVSLGLKQLIKSPWEEARDKYQEGMIVHGKIVRVASFGAFIELEQGVEGLAHISQLSVKRVSKVEDILSVGQEVDAKIIEFNPERKRLSLSLKDVITDKEQAEYRAFLSQQNEGSLATIGELIKQSKEL